MSKENGFAPIRRGIWEHVRDGRMSHLDALAFIYICSQADTRTGIWKGCAKSLAGELGMRERTARDVLEKMEHGDYMRRFAVPGAHSCYPILIHKFPITQGEHNGEQLNALESKSPVDLAYFSRERSVEQTGEHGAAQRRSENRERRNGKKNHAAKPAPPADPRHVAFVKFAHAEFEAKYGQKPSWQGRDWKSLQSLLASNKSLGLEELQSRWRNYLASTEAFTTKHGGRLAYFCDNADSFIFGPILQPVKRGSHAKPAISDAQRTTLDGFQQLEAGERN